MSYVNFRLRDPACPQVNKVTSYSVDDLKKAQRLRA